MPAQLPVVVLDNGAATIKAGVVDSHSDARLIPNAVVRSAGDKTTYFGHELVRCKDYSSLHYRLPFEKGYLVDWDAQKAVWDGIFSADVFGIDTTSASLLITEPYLNMPNIQDVYDQFVFEEYDFHSYYRCTPASVIPFGSLFTRTGLPAPECMLVIDSGFSFTHVVPIMQGSVLWGSVKRLDVGGKLLTNHLKELVSFRQWNMMEQTYIMNNVKEECCFVSTDFKADLATCRDANTATTHGMVQEYVLPDLSTNRKGHVRTSDEIRVDTDQILVMNNERFTVPELIFRPDDIGLDQAGLPETVAASIKTLPEDLQGLFWANIGLIGGTTKFAGFAKRLLMELQSLAPVDCEVVIYECDDPVTEAYQSACGLAREDAFAGCTVTRAEYAEWGSRLCRKRFTGDGKNASVGGEVGAVDKDAVHSGVKETSSSTTSRMNRAKHRDAQHDHRGQAISVSANPYTTSARATTTTHRSRR